MRLVRWVALAALALFVSAACDQEAGGGGSAGNPCEAACDESCGECTGVVVRTLDGDTVELEDGRKIRYLYVNTPETSPEECFGPAASAYNRSLVEGQSVTLGFDVANSGCTDRFDRTLAYVCVGAIWVNEDLARRGYARKYEDATYSYEAELDAALNEAREKQRGGWAPENCAW